jgi:outer membrane protein assembly factor BamC
VFATLPKRPNRLPLAGLVALIASLALGACSVLEEDRVDYKTATKGNALEVPPDLTQLTRDNRYQVPGDAVTASGQANRTIGTSAVATAALTVGDIRIERSGNQRWLVVKRPPEALWSSMRNFWQDNGFLLTLDEQKLGIMETDWAENRAKLPQDFIRNSIGKVFDQLYSTGERDRFRTRLERLPSGETEIYVSHRGLIEKLTGTRAPGQVSSTLWEPRAPDPELEAEFLRRMMVQLGVPKDQTKSVLADSDKAAKASEVVTANGQSQLQIAEGFEVAWRRVGLALDRTGFTVEDRDKSKGTYFVRYAPPSIETKEPGFFSRLVGAKGTDKQVVKYRVVVESSASASTIRVLGGEGTAQAADALNILKIIGQDLR